MIVAQVQEDCNGVLSRVVQRGGHNHGNVSPLMSPTRSKSLALLALFAAFAVFTTGCGSEKSAESKPKAASAAPLAFEEPHELPGNTDTEAAPNAKLRVTPLKIDFDVPPDKYTVESYKDTDGSVPDPIWTRLLVSLKSTGTDPSQQSALNYELLDANGTKYTTNGTNYYKPTISCCGSGYEGNDMLPGDLMAGNVGFAIPQGAKPTKLRVTAMGSDPLQYQVWTIPSEEL
jgi:hypothetical protein